MAIERALGRFETVMSAGWPEQFASLRPGLDDSGIEELRAAISPYLLPRQVEQFYRWRGGGDTGVFGGWQMRSLEDLIFWYRFTMTDLESPGVWLPVFDDQIVSIVTLDLPGEPPSDPSVWYGHTHDASVDRLFDSIEALLDVVCDAAEEGLIHVANRGRLVMNDTESLDGRCWNDLRLRRCPGSFQWPDPPSGTEFDRFPVPDWPREWLAGLG